jgi:ubiquinone/menaquinone biosynthesis C-methylase UbiE
MRCCACPAQKQVIGLDFSMHAIKFCQARYTALPHVDFVRGHALQLPFPDGAFDLVINVEASHAYGDHAAFVREVERVLRTGGQLLYADHRTRRKVRVLKRQLRAAGLAGPCATSRQTWCARANWTARGGVR